MRPKGTLQIGGAWPVEIITEGRAKRAAVTQPRWLQVDESARCVRRFSRDFTYAITTTRKSAPKRDEQHASTPVKDDQHVVPRTTEEIRGRQQNTAVASHASDSARLQSTARRDLFASRHHRCDGRWTRHARNASGHDDGSRCGFAAEMPSSAEIMARPIRNQHEPPAMLTVPA